MSSVNGGWRGSNIVKDGLVLYLDAGSPNSFYSTTAGTTWKDISGNVNNGTLTNGPVYDSTNGGNITFDGSNDYVNCGSNSTITSLTTKITVSLWVKTNVNSSYRKAISIGNPASGIPFYLSLGPAPDYLYFGIQTTSNTYLSANYSSSLNTNLYYNLAGTYGGDYIKLYINGNLVATSPSSANGASMKAAPSYVRISGYDNGNEIWSGNIAIVSMYNKELLATEILQNYNAQKARFGL